MVAISLMMKNIVALRWVNSIGCGIFVLYGTLIEAWPVAGMNAFIVLINMYYLTKMARENNESMSSLA
ncbi:uroporphyrinogen decarboxylase [Endozoicomonas sp. (ex Bugula neritina AB1)]|nr:uroporphyrinogen decarboxylase [Endozoicomonas sp. (ex Bugula neritina AB1)]